MDVSTCPSASKLAHSMEKMPKLLKLALVCVLCASVIALLVWLIQQFI